MANYDWQHQKPWMGGNSWLIKMTQNFLKIHNPLLLLVGVKTIRTLLEHCANNSMVQVQPVL